MLNKSIKISVRKRLICCVLISLLFSVKGAEASQADSLQEAKTEEIKENPPKYKASKLPTSTDAYKGGENDSKADICNTFIEEWLVSATSKPRCNISKEELMSFCEELGYTLFVPDEEIIKKENKKIATFFTCTTALKNAPIRHMPESAHAYQFIHPDFIYFFASLYMIKQWDRIKKDKKLPKLLKRGIYPFLLYYMGKKPRNIAYASNSVRILSWAKYRDFSKENFSGLDLQGIDFRNKKLPQDFTEANLTNANLTGQHFTATKFDWTQMKGTILDKTTCDYQQCFQDNVKANKLSGGSFYRNNLPKDLKSIAQVYPTLAKSSQKAIILQIACGIAYLPYYQGMEFYIKVQYWSCQLYMLKKVLGDLGKQLVCSMGENIEYDANKYGWEMDYPTHLEHPRAIQVASYWYRFAKNNYLIADIGLLIQHFLTLPLPTKDDNFDQYLKIFQEGLVKYHCQSKKKLGYNYYKKQIKKNIIGLQKTYPKLTVQNLGKELAQKLKKEAIDIAFELSQTYKNQDWHLLYSYLFLQNRLIRLKSSAEGACAERNEAPLSIGVGNEVYYRFCCFDVVAYLRWSRGRK